jgi:hypothetical protein
MHLPVIPNIASAARSWSVESQQTSRRNAMLAATQCAQRRAERQDVADYLSARTVREPRPTDATVRTAQR